MKTSCSPDLNETYTRASKLFPKTPEKYMTCRSNTKVEYSPILNNRKSEITICKHFESLEKPETEGRSSDSQLIPTPKTPKNPKENLQKCLLKLKSVHWKEAVLALQDIIQISRFHPHLLAKSMPVVYKGIIAMIKSLRIRAARMACQAANELFINMPHDQGSGFDELVHELLQNTADTNKYLREDALEALDSMVIHVPPAQSIKALLHRRIAGFNLNFRITATKLLTCALRASDIPLNEDLKIKLVFATVRFLEDPNYEIKFHGMRLFAILMEHKDFQNIFQTKITNDLLRQILSIIEAIKSSKRYNYI